MVMGMAMYCRCVYVLLTDLFFSFSLSVGVPRLVSVQPREAGDGCCTGTVVLLTDLCVVLPTDLSLFFFHDL